MTLFGEENPCLVAFRHGFAPYADDLDCSDVRGPHSLFGEGAKPPRPVGDWSPPEGKCASFDGACVLWRGAVPGCSLEARAEAIAGLSASPPAGPVDPFAVPVSTFLAGRSSSSFAIAWKLIEQRLLPEWSGVICSCQTEGRGQLRRPWFSPRGNLYVTFRLPGDAFFQGDVASVATGYLLAKSLRRLGFPVSLKWPNDLLLEDKRKIGGILLEERDGVVLAGLGINLAEAPPPEALREGASVPAGVLLPCQAAAMPGSLMEQDELLAPFSLWRILLSQAILEYGRELKGRTPANLLSLAESLLAWKGREVAVGEDSRSAVRGRLHGLGPAGGLRLCLDNGDIREFVSGSLFLPA